MVRFSSDNRTSGAQRLTCEDSPAARLTTYEVVAVIASLVTEFNFEMVDVNEKSFPEVAEALTVAMKGPLFIKVTARELEG